MPSPSLATAWPPLWAKLNPRHPGLSTLEQRIRGLVLFLTASCLYQGLTQFSLLVACVHDLPQRPLECLGYLALFLLLPIATLALAKRKPLGWTLAVGYLTLSLLGALFGLWVALTWHPSGVTALDALFPRHSPFPSLLQAAVFTGALLALSQPDLRQVFRVSTRLMVKVVAATVLLAITIGVAAW